jgi:TPR repeat protein
MKRIFSLCVFLLMLGVATAQTNKIGGSNIEENISNFINNVTIEAVDGLKTKAEKGDSESEYQLGILYSHGVDVPKDQTEASRWYGEAAEQGHAEAQFSIGTFYVLGIGVSQDFVLAHKWYNLSAAQGIK